MKLYAVGGRCEVCDKPVGPDHFHTLAQVVLWVWDSQHKAYRAAIIAAAAVGSLLIALLIAPLTDLIREIL